MSKPAILTVDDDAEVAAAITRDLRGRYGADYRIVSAMSGAMGGSASEEFLAPAPTGEDTFVSCTNCDYAANTEAVEGRPGAVSTNCGWQRGEEVRANSTTPRR